MAIGSLDFSNMNFNFGSMDFGGLGNFSLPPTFSVFTPEQAKEIQQKFAQSEPLIPITPPATTTQIPPAPTSLPPEPKPQPAPVPNPLPKPEDLSGTKTIKTNANRYKVKETRWEVSASDRVDPLKFQFGDRPVNLYPVLRANGVIVKVDFKDPEPGKVVFEDWYLISPQTLADITKSGNPHYDIAENGRVLNTPVGKTIPIIQLDTDSLKQLIRDRDQANRNAGVKDVVYISETAQTINGIPVGLIDQINYTLDKFSPRPADTFEVYDLGLSGDYGIKELVIQTKQADGKLDQKKLQELLKGVKEKQKSLQTDLNRIKALFYEGNPTYTKTWQTYTQVATGLEPDRKDKTYIIKETELAKTEKSAAETAKDATSKALDELQTTPIDLSWTADLAAVVAKWDAYGFSTIEANSLKRPQSAGSKLVKAKGAEGLINIAINWNEGVCQKARLIAFLPDNQPIDPSKDKNANALREYYGIPTGNRLFKPTGEPRIEDWKQYIKLNDDRKAEVLYMAQLIFQMERGNAKGQISNTATGGGNLQTEPRTNKRGSDVVNDERVQFQ